ncbi:glycoside hydrolase family 32 protein [Nonomuraea deserti]|uniref:Glycoside hydrolase family 32 protein n=1 Tax=Nonomuraea deserti TaxID=1848322 RepID=A0A4R4W3D7_9ACTN|nr:glycoside hydrolase family 32 protein [Nonomuraea deserti]TDD07500.1 glycoside hydrolase family 32 protein [Nonomuraea deserti]
MKRLARGLTSLIALTGMVVAATPSAGHAADYPEFPYQPTTYTEPYRGQFHFSSQGGWMNDPNGLLHYKGTYHFFYQHNPHGLGWDTMHWGHATSTDLVHWTQKPIALEPGVHPGDLWSGAGVVDAANTSGLRDGAEDPLVVFSGTNGVSVFYSTDAGRTFKAYDNGRKVVTMPGTSRDPKVLWHAATKRWVMLVWSDAGGNGVNIYSSPNLLDWTLQSRYAADWLFECPDFFALPVDGDKRRTKWVLTDASGEYVVGDFDGTTFTTDWDEPQRMDHGTNHAGGSFYAGQVFNDMPDDRVVQMVWMGGNQGATWTGNASFPAVLGLRTTGDGVRVTRQPIKELEKLRYRTSSWRGRGLTPATAAKLLRDQSLDTYEVEAEFDVRGATARKFGFKLDVRPGGDAGSEVLYDTAARTLMGAPLEPSRGRVTVRLLVDRGQLEVFGNDGLASITRNVAFDPRADSRGVALHVEGGGVKLVSLRIHELAPAWGMGEPTLEHNLPGQWRVVSGSWTDVAAGKQGSAGGDAFYLSDHTGSDFTYEGDVRLVDGTAAALTFRADARAGRHYTANVDSKAGVVKLWRPGRDIATYKAPIEAGQTYHLKVVTQGQSIKVYLDDRAEPVIDAKDDQYASGHFGLNVFDGTAQFQNIRVS